MTVDPEATGWSGPTRRTVLRALGAGATLAGIGATAGAAQSAEPWTVVALPDTQYYAEDGTSYPRDQAEWIVDNVGGENIVHVSHLGDVVENGDVEAEWEHMAEALAPLDGAVSFSTLPGNHDWATQGDRTSSIENYRQYFGPSQNAGPDDLNSYQLFSAGGYDFLHLALEWEIPGDIDDASTALGWAQSVLEQYPDRPTIVSTHSYLREFPQRRRTLQVQERNGIGTEGQTVWEELIAPNSQVFMVLCGHWHRGDGEADQVSSNDDGEDVYEMLSNFQDRDNGGNGLLRQIRFQPGGGSGDDPDRIQVQTYSPSTDEYLEDDDSEFGFDLDFDARFGSASDGPLAGDADGDGDVDSDDVEAIQRSIAGEDVDIDSEAADVDDDGDVDIGDAIRVRNISEDGQ